MIIVRKKIFSQCLDPPGSATPMHCCVFCCTVIVFCFWYGSVQPRLLVRAHVNNMTNGDFVFFTWFPLRSFHTDRPWRSAERRYVDDPQDIQRLRQAYTVIKQVKGKGKGALWLLVEFHVTATGRHLPYGITQFYLPPDTTERAPPSPQPVGRCSIYLPRRDGRLS